MLNFNCDWCGIARRKGEPWLMGVAAERVGALQTRREFHLSPEWSEADAASPLAVHFCSEEHMREYVAALFAPGRRARKKAAAAGGARVAALTATEAPATPAKRTAASRATRKGAFTKADQLRAHALGIRLK